MEEPLGASDETRLGKIVFSDEVQNAIEQVRKDPSHMLLSCSVQFSMGSLPIPEGPSKHRSSGQFRLQFHRLHQSDVPQRAVIVEYRRRDLQDGMRSERN